MTPRKEHQVTGTSASLKDKLSKLQRRTFKSKAASHFPFTSFVVVSWHLSISVSSPTQC